jgi:hypothetical protein
MDRTRELELGRRATELGAELTNLDAAEPFTGYRLVVPCRDLDTVEAMLRRVRRRLAAQAEP